MGSYQAKVGNMGKDIKDFNLPLNVLTDKLEAVFC